MAASLQRYDSMVFDNKTTHITDYKVPNTKLLEVKTVFVPKKKRPRPPYERLKSPETLCKWQGLPFDLWIKPKEIVRGNPKKVQKAYTETPDLDREEVQMTRPRLVMTPIVAIDNVTKEKRQILVDDIYTSTAMRVQREGTALFKGAVKAPIADYVAPPKPIKLPYTVLPVVPPEWRMESVVWDGKQARAHCDPSKDFWMRRNTTCKVCEQTAKHDMERKLRPMNPPKYEKLSR